MLMDEMTSVLLLYGPAQIIFQHSDLVCIYSFHTHAQSIICANIYLSTLNCYTKLLPPISVKFFIDIFKFQFLQFCIWKASPNTGEYHHPHFAVQFMICPSEKMRACLHKTYAQAIVAKGRDCEIQMLNGPTCAIPQPLIIRTAPNSSPINSISHYSRSSSCHAV